MPYFIANGATIHYEIKGEGLPILCIHPPLLTGSIFYYQQKELQDRYQVITVDLRGHGRSSLSAHTFTYKGIASDLNQLLEHLCIEQAVLLGYSTGGSIALEMMLQTPQHIRGAILLSGMAHCRSPYLHRLISVAEKIARRGALHTLAMVIGYSNANNPLTFIRNYRDAVKGNPIGIADYYHYATCYDVLDRLHEINHPILLLTGENDPHFSGFATEMASQLPMAKVRSIPRYKHQLPTKAYHEVNLLVHQFINSFCLRSQNDQHQ
ncbi:alpha/beta fold hydrolase [Brevibacillus laterosporus]|uniref:alpha/beta fold hydrolase n=1 Tax=Brevibacillus laterosporus TaxID=1465 RepID=UPI000B9B01F8|nr:alpha/beta hydrolase [Brevibacillus laterosporus]